MQFVTVSNTTSTYSKMNGMKKNKILHFQKYYKGVGVLEDSDLRVDVNVSSFPLSLSVTFPRK